MSETNENVVNETPVEETSGLTGTDEPVVDDNGTDEIPAEPVDTEADQIEQMLIDMYEIVSHRIRASVALGKLTPDNFQVMILKVVEVVEDFSSKSDLELTGVEKRDIAIRVTQKVVDDLHAHGHIDEEMYGWFSLSLMLMGPALFSGMKAVYKIVHGVVVDVSDNGCKGCFGRNFGSKGKKVTK